MGAERRTGNSTPWTPQASALRSSVPTFWGSSSESSTSTKRWLAALACACQDVVEGRPAARLHDQRHPLVTVEAGERGQGAALDLHDRDAQRRGMQHELLERCTTLGHDQQARRVGGQRTPPPPAGDRRPAPRPRRCRSGAPASHRRPGCHPRLRGRPRQRVARAHPAWLVPRVERRGRPGPVERHHPGPRRGPADAPGHRTAGHGRAIAGRGRSAGRDRG